MISVKFLKNGYRLPSQIGTLVKQTGNNIPDKTMAYKQKVFNEQHRSHLINQDFREFLCGDCKLRQSYLNKKARDSFEKEADLIKGIF